MIPYSKYRGFFREALGVCKTVSLVASNSEVLRAARHISAACTRMANTPEIADASSAIWVYAVHCSEDATHALIRAGALGSGRAKEKLMDACERAQKGFAEASRMRLWDRRRPMRQRKVQS